MAVFANNNISGLPGSLKWHSNVKANDTIDVHSSDEMSQNSNYKEQNFPNRQS